MTSPIKLSSRLTHEYWEIPVLFEDDHLLALDKPARLPASPERDDPTRPSLMALLHAGIRAGDPWAQARGLDYLAQAHRLDAETSGALLLAKNKRALITLVNHLGSEKPAKTFVALVQGAPAKSAFEIVARLAPDPRQTGRMRVDAQRGKKSITACQVEESFAGYALVRCCPRTDRNHQVRVHLRSQRLPIVGDSLYGGKPLWLSRLKRAYRLKAGRQERPLIGRTALHAASLSLPHPVTGEDLEIVSPWPKDFRVAVKYLRLFAPAR